MQPGWKTVAAAKRGFALPASGTGYFPTQVLHGFLWAMFVSPLSHRRCNSDIFFFALPMCHKPVHPQTLFLRHKKAVTLLNIEQEELELIKICFFLSGVLPKNVLNWEDSYGTYCSNWNLVSYRPDRLISSGSWQLVLPWRWLSYSLW